MWNLKPKDIAPGKAQVEGVDSYLSLGSNLGDRMGYMKRTIDSIAGLREVEVRRISRVFETEPVGMIDQPMFLNMAVGVVTSLPPEELLARLKIIEKAIGRVDRPRWREREIDIDIIFYDRVAVKSDKLTIPHERAHLRRFVLEPLSEIAPEFEHPVLHKTVTELLAECPDKSAVRLRRELSDVVS